MIDNLKLYLHISLLSFAVIFIFNGCVRCSESGRRYEQKKKTEKIKLEKVIKIHEESEAKYKETNEVNEKIVEKDDQYYITKTVIKMEKQGGVYKIPVEINGLNMFFIFDTGASLISISETEVNFLLKQEKLSEDDFLGSAKFIDANGDISEGTLINLKEVRIGDRILTNIEASVVHNMKAPLLFGQSALEKFGKISIDYKKEELIFE